MAATSWQTQLRGSTNQPRRLRREERKRPRKHKVKPPWDDTSSDLTAYRPSTEELARRHDIHKPTPLSERKYLQLHQNMLIQEEKENMFVRKTAFQDNVERKKALIKEIFHNQEKELHSVLVETDRTMAQVKDLFGDDPMKFKGIPHVTAAPNLAEDENCSVLGIDNKVPSRLAALSNSVMIHPALNDISDDPGDSSEEDHAQDSFESKLDLDYYKNLIHQEQIKDHNHGYNKSSQSKQIQIHRISGLTDHSAKQHHHDNPSTSALESNSVIVRPSTVTNYPEVDSISKNPDAEYSSCVLGGAPGTRHLQGNRDASTDVLQKESRNRLGKFEHLKKVLDVLEGELSVYELDSRTMQSSGEEVAASNPVSDVASVLNVIANLVHHLKESEIQVQAERAMHENLIQGFQEQRTLIDALTGDLIETQEQNSLLREEFTKYMSKTSQDLVQIKEELSSLKLRDSSTNNVTAGKQDHTTEEY